MVIQQPKIRKIKNTAIRVTVVAVAYTALWYQLRKYGGIHAMRESWMSWHSSSDDILLLSLVVIMMGINWSLEALKWRYLIRKSEKISFFRSLKAIFTGISVGTFTPNRLGEFLGRSFILERSHPWKVFFMTIIGSYSQLIATVLFGAAGLLLFASRFTGLSTGFTYLDMLIAFFVVVSLLFLLLLYFNIDILDRYLGPWLRNKKPGFASWFHVIAGYSSVELLVVLLFSAMRYAVFSLQFFILLRIFDFQITLGNSLLFTSVIYLVMTVIPSIALS
ncbi:MAG: lysylphosphatidylglycerol synthase domain-containing protein, partial [Bacteroidales bacterium]